jgi:NADH-quinone oxidoreductase subunit N
MTLDFVSQADYLWALLPEILLCVFGMVVLVAGVWKPSPAPERIPSTDLGWVALGGILLAALANGWLYGVQEVGDAGMIALDRYRLYANWIFLLGAALTVLISFTYVARQRFQVGEFYSLILLATAGMMFMAGTRDLIVIFLGLEVMSISAYVLTAFNRRDRKSSEAGLKYFFLGAFATAFLLYGIALVYGAAGSTNLVLVGQAVAAGAAQSPLLVVGVALLGIGFAFKVSAVPFHMWTPDVYEGAPTPVTAFMSTAVKAAAFVAFLRVFLTAFDGLYESWYPVFWWMAVATMVVANLIALAQSNVKRMLAYSSIAHAGYLLVALVAANETAAAGLLFYLLIYTVMNIGALGIVVSVANHGEEKLQIEDYAGFGWRQPLLGVFFTIFLLSLAGFPGTAGFMAKIYLLLGAVDAQLWTLAVILVLTTVVSYWYYLRLAWYMWMRESPTTSGAVDPFFVPLPLRAALLASAGIILLLGIFPGLALDFARDSVAGLLSSGVLLGQQ